MPSYVRNAMVTAWWLRKYKIRIPKEIYVNLIDQSMTVEQACQLREILRGQMPEGFILKPNQEAWPKVFIRQEYPEGYVPPEPATKKPKDPPPSPKPKPKPVAPEELPPIKKKRPAKSREPRKVIGQNTLAGFVKKRNPNG